MAWTPIRVMWVLCFLPLLLLLILPTGAQSTAKEEFFVKPTEGTPCHHKHCRTLNKYVENYSRYFQSNATFIFLPGTHHLSHVLSVTGLANLTMKAANGNVNITCHNHSYFSFCEVCNLTLENLSISSSCDNISFINIYEFSHLISLTVESPMHIGFTDPVTENVCCDLHSHNQLTVWNTAGILEVVTFHQSSYAVVLNIVNATATGISYIDIGSENSSKLRITDSIFGGTLYFTSTRVSHMSSLYLDNCQFVCSGASGAVIHFHSLSSPGTLENSQLFCHSKTILFQQSALYIDSSSHIVVRNVIFSNIMASEFTAPNTTEAYRPIIRIENANNVSLINCTFQNNELIYAYRQFAVGSIVFVENSTEVTFSNCEFVSNKGTPILASDSTLIFSQYNVFRNNTAYQGGALAFYGRSYINFNYGSKTEFHNNSADDTGGAIYVQGEGGTLVPMYQQCFFQIHVVDACFNQHVRISFANNTAKQGGNAIYGAALDVCTTKDYGCMGWQFINATFDLSPNNGSDFSVISSSPLRACLCEGGRPSCTTVVHSVSHFPGEEFNVSAVVVGDRFGTVNGSVYAQVLPFNITGESAALEETQYSQQIGYDQCTNLSYTVYYSSDPVCIALTSEVAKVQECPTAEKISNFILPSIYYYNTTGTINPMLATLPVLINVTLRPCPLGFMLSGHPLRCTCDPQLQEYSITCDLAKQTVQCNGTFWVNPFFHNDTSDGVILSKYCPNNYCKSETVDVNLTHPDTQCAFRHSGILCGGCQSGLSLALGSPQCLHCSNAHLALLLPFALAGIALVLLLKILNLTVTDGTLHGLIFYANIVRANQSLWVPNGTNVLTVFIAWLNLDLGIETCFVDGLDAYWKTWLQFVFPFYIWAIVLLIIVLCRYSTVATKIFGSNSVPVLATLFLLSYAKLLRTVISILQPSILHYPNGKTATVWSYDGNVTYLGPKHIPLVVVAILLLLFLWLPYTGILIFAQCLQRTNNFKVDKLLGKINPFLDAYFGPLKPKHRYWVGLLLLVRGILFVVYAATPTELSTIDLLATVIAILCLLVYPYAGWVYRNTYLNILESSFLLNVSILALGTLYIDASGGDRAALAYTSVGICFTQFSVMVAFYIFKLVGGPNRCARLYDSCFRRAPWRKASTEDTGLLEDSEVPLTYLDISFPGYREPVLQYEDL